MTDLTADEKAQVAELLGWSRVLPSRFDDEATWFKTDGDLCWTEFPPFTLEALLAYCQERGWRAALEYWPSLWIEDDNETDYRENVFIGEVTVRPDDDPEEDGAVTCNAIHSDPLTALVRAVLAAHEQEKAG